ncbi:MAG: hypothetical protein RJA70_3651 [Pseudomonadota bacterium]|jgi:hypothetical protein
MTEPADILALRELPSRPPLSRRGNARSCDALQLNVSAVGEVALHQELVWKLWFSGMAVSAAPLFSTLNATPVPAWSVWAASLLMMAAFCYFAGRLSQCNHLLTAELMLQRHQLQRDLEQPRLSPVPHMNQGLKLCARLFFMLASAYAIVAAAVVASASVPTTLGPEPVALGLGACALGFLLQRRSISRLFVPLLQGAAGGAATAITIWVVWSLFAGPWALGLLGVATAVSVGVHLAQRRGALGPKSEPDAAPLAEVPRTAETLPPRGSSALRSTRGSESQDRIGRSLTDLTSALHDAQRVDLGPNPTTARSGEFQASPTHDNELNRTSAEEALEVEATESLSLTASSGAANNEAATGPRSAIRDIARLPKPVDRWDGWIVPSNSDHPPPHSGFAPALHLRAAERDLVPPAADATFDPLADLTSQLRDHWQLPWDLAEATPKRRPKALPEFETLERELRQKAERSQRRS